MASTTRYEISHVSRCLYASPVRGCVMSLCLKTAGHNNHASVFTRLQDYRCCMCLAELHHEIWNTYNK